jgi:DNA-binding transcriptional regulator LsrR (DeoR family)
MMQTEVEKRQAIERKVVRKLIRTLKDAGWIAIKVNDGGDEWIKTPTESSVMEAVFAVDESNIIFKKGSVTQWVFIVLGNLGWDVINDYIDYSHDDSFEKAMEVVSDYCDTLEDMA